MAFKNLTFGGKVEGKKLMGFGGGKPAYDVLLNASTGEVYEVTTNKNPAGYIDWIAAVKSEGGAAPGPAPSRTAPTNVGNTSGSTTTTRSTYETPEERAKKQVYIVRQSSLSSAIDLLSVGSKSSPDVEKVIETAKRFEDFVFGTNQSDTEVAGSFFPDSPKPRNPELDDGGDDIPW